MIEKLKPRKTWGLESIEVAYEEEREMRRKTDIFIEIDSPLTPIELKINEIIDAINKESEKK